MDNSIDPKYFFFDLPLYQPIDIASVKPIENASFLNKNFRIDAYNPDLKENSTYKIYREVNRNVVHNGKFQLIDESYYPHLYIFKLQCTRSSKDSWVIIHFNEEENTIQKIGQYPSIADFHISQIKSYKKVLDKEKLKEFTKAIGLAANGVGVGSFVYLRRIFESLIFEAFQVALSEGKIKKEEFEGVRMSEKIGLLKDYLPDFLSDNKVVYGILSKGVHELTEKECLDYFVIVKNGIELILDEKLEKLEKEEKKKAVSEKIAQLNQSLAQKKS